MQGWPGRRTASSGTHAGTRFRRRRRGISETSGAAEGDTQDAKPANRFVGGNGPQAVREGCRPDKRSSCIPPSSAYHRLLDNCEIVRKSLKIAGEPYKPDSVGLQQVGVLTIIPLGCNSHCSSSSLPEGCSRQWPACLTQDVPFSRERRKFSFALLDEPGRLSPPIWPCTTRGFPCLVCCQTSGRLLPHRFTLTSKSAFARR